MTDFVLLNGPPGSGKDTVGELVGALYEEWGDNINEYHGVRMMKFATPLKKHVCSMLNINMQTLEKIKDKPHYILNGDTPRQYMIHYDKFIKDKYGNDFFGCRFADKLEDIDLGDTKAIIVTDCGFIEELLCLVDKVNLNRHNVKLVQLHRTRCTFEDDSRSYLNPGMIETLVVDNNDKTIQETAEEIFQIMQGDE